MARLRKIRSDETGATVVEFAMVLPILLVMVIGIFDVAMNLYAQSVLQGLMQQAGREFSLEDSRDRQAKVEGYITDQIKLVAPGAQLQFVRDAYFDFSDVGEPETFVDGNSDGECNNGEIFDDYNGNGTFDLDRGESGFGGARDAVLFTSIVTYPRLFPMDGLLGLTDTVTIRASTVLRNQPFDDQDRTFPTGNCS
ncbi:TadE/TadG family type IV pilus assembly protein [Alteraurantiacibacter aquimixticola]|uniref:Pilus assembly protein n=1 Tax=Alteraurantiacibacter aquimixticola TaxID=2489173 RepID=A0A4T3EZ77_9SPHN|nr:TadE family protein [Alteraurantiacibacter aquimixticola]TIX50061.1 pilus assembly protein [Alteraurantiacibacter aquimixticola]